MASDIIINFYPIYLDKAANFLPPFVVDAVVAAVAAAAVAVVVDAVVAVDGGGDDWSGKVRD